MFEHWIRIKDQMSTNKSRFPLIHVIESPNRPRIRIQYWPSTMCSCQVVSLSGVSGKGFWAPHCGYRRYFSSQRRCITAVLLCTSGGLLSLVNIKSTHPPLPNWYSSNWNASTSSHSAHLSRRQAPPPPARRAHNQAPPAAVDQRPRNCAHLHNPTFSTAVIVLWSVMRILVVAAVCCAVAINAKAVGGGKDGLQVEKSWNF